MWIRPVFWAKKEARLRICFSNVNLSSSIIHWSLRELETSKTNPHKINGRLSGCRDLDRLIVINHDERCYWNLTKSLFKELTTFLQSTSAYKVVSSYEIILFSRPFLISTVYRMKNNGPKTLPWRTTETTGVHQLKFPSTKPLCWRLILKKL